MLEWGATAFSDSLLYWSLKELARFMYHKGFPGDSVVKNLPVNAGQLGLIPGSGRPPGGGNGHPLQYSCLENPMDGGAWWASVHGVAKNWTRLSDFTFTFHFHALEKEMATHFTILVWEIPWTEEPGGLQSMGSRRVRYS